MRVDTGGVSSIVSSRSVMMRAFADRQPVLIRRIRRVWVAWTWASLLLLAAGLILLPVLRDAVQPWLWCYYALIQIYLVARTKSLSWRFAAVTFTASVPLAIASGLAEMAVGARWAAGPLEEILTLLPLIVLLVVARRRVRGFGAVDFLIVGFASGAAFQAVEDAIRHTAGDTLGGGPQYGLGWLPGSSTMGEAVFAGQAVGTGLVAVAVGLAMRAGRRHWVLPVVLLVMVFVDHMMYDDVTAAPGWIASVWDAWGNGALQRPLLTALLIVALVVDVRVLQREWGSIPPVPDLGFAHALRRPFARLGRTARREFSADAAPVLRALAVRIAGVIAWVGTALVTLLHEVALLLMAASRQPGQPRRHRWYAGMFYLRIRRQLAYEMAAQAPAAQVAETGRQERPPPALPALPALVLIPPIAAPLLAAYGPFDGLATWWVGLLTWQQLLAAAVAAGLLTFGGMGFWGAVGLAGTSSTLAAHGHGGVAFIRDPGQATRSFVASLTPTQVLGYWLEIALGRVVSAAAGGVRGAHLRQTLDGVLADPLGFVRRYRELLGKAAAVELDPGTVNRVIEADPAELSVSARLLQQDYRRHLTGPSGRALDAAALEQRVRDLRIEGQRMVVSGRTVPNSRYAGQCVFFKDGSLSVRYPDGVYIDVHGFPDFGPFAEKEVPLPTTGDRSLDIRLANRLMSTRGETMWELIASGDTPAGFVWHHVQDGQRMQLVIEVVHLAIRHAGAVATSEGAKGADR